MEMNVAQRLSLQVYSAEDCLAALRGERVPLALGLPLTRLCIVRGIRYHNGFGEELYRVHPMFTRALNARRIMSNLIPDQFMHDNEIPYCIWHPQTASEHTYRTLAHEFPQLRYQVGRACAVANYSDLYNELGLRPDIHIAEEARECGSRDIFVTIMAAPARFDIMDDYNLSVDIASSQHAYLNGDTAVRWTLDVKQKFRPADPEDDNEDSFNLFADKGFEETTFNITEDMSIGEHESPRNEGSREMAQLLSSPLPLDLPTVDKDLLILMAAYDGNIDRYARLRRPVMMTRELQCCVRGIYHNTQFALWWSRQHRKKLSAHIVKAINARLIMNNVLSSVEVQLPGKDLPYLIWYPTLALESTYRKLWFYQPRMAPQILRACIVGNYHSLFDDILKTVAPDAAVMYEVDHDFTRKYKDKLDQRVSELGSTAPPLGSHEEWKVSDTAMLDRSSDWMDATLSPEWISTGFGSLYNGLQCDASSVSFISCLPDNWRTPMDVADAETSFDRLDYVNWPPQKADIRKDIVEALL